MESKAVGFIGVVAVLGIISAAAGFAGEATRVKVTIRTISNLEKPSIGLPNLARTVIIRSY